MTAAIPPSRPLLQEAAPRPNNPSMSDTLRPTLAVTLVISCAAACGTPGYDVGSRSVTLNDYTGNPLLPGGIVRREIPLADATTFIVLSTEPPYGKDAAYVYFKNEVIAGADTATFRPLGDSHYGADAPNAFFESFVIPGADVATFQPYGYRYASDATHTYHHGRLLEGVRGVVTPLGGERYFKDQTGAIFYWAAGHFGNLDPIVWRMDVCDATTFFESVSPMTGAEAQDSACLYVRGMRIPLADRATYHHLGGFWSKDAGGVYFGASRIPDASPSNFQLHRGEHGEVLGRDSNNRCWRGELLNALSREPASLNAVVKVACPTTLLPF